MSGEFDAAQLKLLVIDVFGTPISGRDSCCGACAGNLRTHCGAAHVDPAGPSGRPLKSATLRGIRDFNVSLLEQRNGDGSRGRRAMREPTSPNNSRQSGDRPL
jgi:hypothetical protein